MKLRFLRGLVVLPLAGVMFVGGQFTTHTARAGYTGPDNEIQARIISGFADYELNPNNSLADQSQQPSNYQPRGSNTCSVNISSNIKINQNCLDLTSGGGGGQANNETSISQDPNNPNNIIASDNDYRRGDGSCYSAYSTDKARTWNDTTLPNDEVSGQPFGQALEYFEASGDTSVDWDTHGNAYLACQMFQRPGATANPDFSSSVYLFRSTGNDGASWNFPGRPVVTLNDSTGTGSGLIDKPYMTVDNHVGSPFQDRIYVTYTNFNFVTGTAYIFESYSNDFGQTFNGPHLVSTTSGLCTITFGAGTGNGNCNENQDSQPFTGSDGNLYVVYNNYNNAVKGQDNRNQMLLAKSVDGGNTFSPPVKVADYYDLPDCATYQAGKDAGRACVPEKSGTSNSFFRATNYPVGAVNPTNPSQVAVSFGSYINRNSNEANGCVPTSFSPATGNNLYTGVKTPGACNNDILLSVSNDGGATFTGTTTDPRALTTVTQDAAQATTDQFFQWLAFNKLGKLAVSYYDRQYGTDETTGFSDVSLSGSADLTNFGVQRVTSTSMPPPTQFRGLFLGDYSGLTAVDNAYPAWADTRPPGAVLCPGSGTPGNPPTVCTAQNSSGQPLNDQDIFTASQAIPSR